MTDEELADELEEHAAALPDDREDTLRPGLWYDLRRLLELAAERLRGK